MIIVLVIRMLLIFTRKLKITQRNNEKKRDYTLFRLLNRNIATEAAMIIPYLIFDFHPMTLAQLGCLLLAGLFASGGQFTITAAYTCAPAGEISIYDYSQIIFSTVLGFLFLRQIPDMWSFVGYGIIIAASVAMFLFNNRKRV